MRRWFVRDPTTGTSLVINLDLPPNEDSTAVTALAEDTLLDTYPLTVEFAGKVPGFEWLTEVVVKLPDNLPAGQDVLVSITWHAEPATKRGSKSDKPVKRCC